MSQHQERAARRQALSELSHQLCPPRPKKHVGRPTNAERQAEQDAIYAEAFAQFRANLEARQHGRPEPFPHREPFLLGRLSDDFRDVVRAAAFLDREP